MAYGCSGGVSTENNRPVETVSGTGLHRGLVESARSIVDVLDINTACHHAIVDFDSNAELFGRVRLGLDAGSPLV